MKKISINIVEEKVCVVNKGKINCCKQKKEGEMKKDLNSILLRKAVGYTAKEVVEEYSGDDELLKKKISTKHIPPDIAALKTYLEINKCQDQFQSIGDDELQKMKIKLLNELSSLQDICKSNVEEKSVE